MTWLADVPDGETDWERLASLCPEAFEALAGLERAARETIDADLLELVRLRIATLLRNPAELSRLGPITSVPQEKIAALPAWPTSPLFTPRERACLALTEQFIIDANGVTDNMVADVTEHLGPEGCYAFVQAVSALEGFQRACLTMGIATMPELHGVSPSSRSGGST